MKKFDDELVHLHDHVIEMGTLARRMVGAAIGAINDGDTSVAKEIYADEHQLDKLQLDVDREAIRLLTVYSPVASNLRYILSVTRITQELERIGDQAENMCEYLELIASRNDVPVLPIVQKMSALVVDMLKDALLAFSEKDVDRAMVVIRSDNRVDALNGQVLHDLLGGPNQIGANDSLSTALAVILIARALERIGDQATNICEEVVYMLKGADIRHAESDEEVEAVVHPQT